MPYTEAVGLVMRGEVEAIVTPGGRLRYLRLLPLAERVPATEFVAGKALDPDGGTDGSTAIARTNMGVYREAVREAIVTQDAHGNRAIVSSGGIVGYIFQHRGLRNRNEPAKPRSAS